MIKICPYCKKEIPITRFTIMKIYCNDRCKRLFNKKKDNKKKLKAYYLKKLSGRGLTEKRKFASS